MALPLFSRVRALSGVRHCPCASHRFLPAKCGALPETRLHKCSHSKRCADVRLPSLPLSLSLSLGVRLGVRTGMAECARETTLCG